MLGSGVSELSVGTTLNWLWQVALADLLNLLVDVDNWKGDLGGGSVRLGSGDLLLGGITLLGLTKLAWEENKTGTVSLQAGNVGGKGLVGEVLSSWVDGDTDGWRKLAWDSSLLQFMSDPALFSSFNPKIFVPSTQ